MKKVNSFQCSLQPYLTVFSANKKAFLQLGERPFIFCRMKENVKRFYWRTQPGLLFDYFLSEMSVIVRSA